MIEIREVLNANYQGIDELARRIKTGEEVEDPGRFIEAWKVRLEELGTSGDLGIPALLHSVHASS